MAEEKIMQNPGERSWVSYAIGVIVLVVIGFFVFREGIPWFSTRGNSVTPTPTTTKEVSVTIEGVLGQLDSSRNSFPINTPSSFTSLAYTGETNFLDEQGRSV